MSKCSERASVQRAGESAANWLVCSERAIVLRAGECRWATRAGVLLGDLLGASLGALLGGMVNALLGVC